MKLPDDPSTDLILAHYGEELKHQGAVVPPIYQNSLFLFDTAEEMAGTMMNNPSGPPYVYTRISNPTMEVTERKLAKLEGTDRAKVYGSGMAALTAAAMTSLQAGSHCVLIDTIYGPMKQLITEYLARFGVTHTLVSGICPDEVIDAMRPETTLVCLESPSSLVFQLQDLRAITKEAKARGITTMIDNTYSTPLYQQPASMGVDLIAHSATKYIGGHSDIVAGVVCGSEERIQKMIREEVSLIGSAASPLTSWLMMRGLRTLALRVKRHQETANTVANWLDEHPKVARVMHLGLQNFPQRDLVRSQMAGTTGLFSFVPEGGDQEKCYRFVNALQIFGRGVSWGGHESLAVTMPVQPMGWAQQEWIVRLYCGLEDAPSLIADLDQAFGVAGF